jgi:hypothetical protein
MLRQSQARLKTAEGRSTPQLAVCQYPVMGQKPELQGTLVPAETATLVEGDAKRIVVLQDGGSVMS